MAFKDNKAAIEVFKTDMLAVKTTSIIKYKRIREKTLKYVSAIDNNKLNYSTSSELDILHAGYIEYCNNILTFFVNLDSQYLTHWKGL